MRHPFNQRKRQRVGRARRARKVSGRLVEAYSGFYLCVDIPGHVSLLLHDLPAMPFCCAHNKRVPLPVVQCDERPLMDVHRAFDFGWVDVYHRLFVSNVEQRRSCLKL